MTRPAPFPAFTDDRRLARARAPWVNMEVRDIHRRCARIRCRSILVAAAILALIAFVLLGQQRTLPGSIPDRIDALVQKYAEFGLFNGSSTTPPVFPATPTSRISFVITAGCRYLCASW